MQVEERYIYARRKEVNNQLNVWCAFPAVYNIGMSALGYLTVFKYIDTTEGIKAERIFTDTQTTDISSREIDVITFSFSFELDYLGILKILDKYKIPFFSKDRDENFPLICGGGPVLSANPEPFAKLFDFIMIGDCESNIQKIFKLIKENKGKPKEEILNIISDEDGVYIPVKKEEGYRVKKSTAQLKQCAATPIITHNSYFPDTYIIEIERGCPQRCGFCMTSYINSPVRYYSYEEIIKQIETGLKYTNKLALLGALICSHPDIDRISEYIINKKEEISDIEVSVSSLRADYVSDKTLEMLHKCGQRTATIAVEAGSERLRRVINKNLTKSSIMEVIKKMAEKGFNGVKIYGIIGLPTETYKDIDEFIELCKEIKQKYKGFNVIPSFSTFVPKAQTPFQYARREESKSLEKKNEYIKKEFAKIGIKARTSSVKWDDIQALISRGGRELTEYLTDVYKQGGNLGAFRSVYREYTEKNILKPLEEVINKCISPEQETEWEFIEYFNNKEILQKEYKRLINSN